MCAAGGVFKLTVGAAWESYLSNNIGFPEQSRTSKLPSALVARQEFNQNGKDVGPLRFNVRKPGLTSVGIDLLDLFINQRQQALAELGHQRLSLPQVFFESRAALTGQIHQALKPPFLNIQ